MPSPMLVMASAMCRKCSKNLVAMSSYDVIVLGELQRDAHQVEAVHRHPARAVGLVDVAARRQRRAAVEDADVVQAEEAALEDVAPLGVLPVDPPGEVQHQLVEHALEKREVSRVVLLGQSTPLAIHLKDAPGGPAMHGRIDVAKRPLVGGQLAVRVHVPLTRQEDQLLLRKVGIDQRKRDRMKGEIPRGVPRVLPFVRHRDDVGVVQMPPLVIAPSLCALPAGGGWPGSPFSHCGTS